MPKICYREKRFGDSRVARIDQANDIIEEYKEKGFEITLRQLYYQFVARGFIENNQREYKNLGDLINDARLAGLVDWLAIVDLTRELDAQPTWQSPAEIVAACAEQFRIDKWDSQPTRIEVWIEKDAVSNIAAVICRKLFLPFFSCRGYTSQSEMWKAAQRLAKHADRGQVPVILHLGDHDPSGKDMTRDIQSRLTEFSGHEIQVERLALNMNQIKRYNPPPNPAKLTDSRSTQYISEFGDESWELDALSPEVMSDLIESKVLYLRDEDKWEEAVKNEEGFRRSLDKVSSNWDSIMHNL